MQQRVYTQAQKEDGEITFRVSSGLVTFWQTNSKKNSIHLVYKEMNQEKAHFLTLIATFGCLAVHHFILYYAQKLVLK